MRLVIHHLARPRGRGRRCGVCQGSGQGDDKSRITDAGFILSMASRATWRSRLEPGLVDRERHPAPAEPLQVERVARVRRVVAGTASPGLVNASSTERSHRFPDKGVTKACRAFENPPREVGHVVEELHNVLLPRRRTSRGNALPCQRPKPSGQHQRDYNFKGGDSNLRCHWITSEC